MLHVLIVKSDPVAAAALAEVLKRQSGYLVVGFADDLRSARETARSSNVHIAFIDTELSRLDSGYRIADELNDLGISCVLVTAGRPPFPMPEIAAAWLEEPYTVEMVVGALLAASADLLAPRQSANRLSRYKFQKSDRSPRVGR